MQTVTINFYITIKMAAEEMFAKRQPGQVGNPLANCHPPKALKNVEWVIQQLRSGKTDAIRVHVPMHGPDTYVVHNYQAMYDDNGNYAGINEYILDFKPIVDWYLKQTGQELVGGKTSMQSVVPQKKRQKRQIVSQVHQSMKKSQRPKSQQLTAFLALQLKSKITAKIAATSSHTVFRLAMPNEDFY